MPVIMGRSGSAAELRDKETAERFKEHGAKLREERSELQHEVNDRAYAEVKKALKGLGQEKPKSHTQPKRRA